MNLVQFSVIIRFFSCLSGLINDMLFVDARSDTESAVKINKINWAQLIGIFVQLTFGELTRSHDEANVWIA